MPCSICKVGGHNARTCPSKTDVKREVAPKKKKEKVNLNKTPFNMDKYSEIMKELKEKRKNQYDLANECVQSLV